MLVTAVRFKKYFENLSWLILDKGFSLIVGMVVGIYVARYLQPEAFGALNYGIGFVSIFSAFATFGMDQIVVRELAKGQRSKDELLGTAFILKLFGSFMLISMILVILLFMRHTALTNTLILIIAFAEMFKAFEVISYFFQSEIRSKYVVQVQLLINLTISLSKIGLVFAHASLISFAVIVVIGAALTAVGFIYSYNLRQGSLRQWRFKKALAAELLKESWPLALYGFALHTQARVDQVMLGNMLSNYEVGQYSVALRFIEIFGFVPMVLMSTFTPAVTRARNAGSELYESRLVNLYRLMFAAFLLMAIPIYLFGETVVTVLYGSEYQAAGVLLSLFALRLFFSNMGVGKSVFIVNESLFKYSLLTVILGAITNFSLNYFLIPLYASKGAFVGSMLSFCVSIFLVDTMFEKTRYNQKLMFRGIVSFWKLKTAA
jgi:O-antigen/teichoic acid export membrane protein